MDVRPLLSHEHLVNEWLVEPSSHLYLTNCLSVIDDSGQLLFEGIKEEDEIIYESFAHSVNEELDEVKESVVFSVSPELRKN